MTGAPIPQEADAVAQSEITSEQDGYVLVYETVRPGKNIRRAGEDVVAGRPGARGRRPRSGPRRSECLPAWAIRRFWSTGGLGWPSSPRGASWSRSTSPWGPGRSATRTATRFGRCAGNWAWRPLAFGIVPDDYDATRQAIRAGLEYDVLLTSGGVSVGKFDFVKDVQDELGVERRLWGVAMKPGKPLAFGVRGEHARLWSARQPGVGHGLVRAVRHGRRCFA